MKTILITGANGFIGNYIKEFGNFKNYKIIYGTTSQIQNGYMLFDKLYSNINEVLKNQQIDIIIHCASIIPNSFDASDKKLFLDNNTMMINLYEFSLQQKLKKFIYTSGFGSMENPGEYDIKDYYTLSKITGEHICSMMQSKGIETAILRISSPFGEFYHNSNVLSLFIDLALQNKPIHVYGTGNREQNFIYAGNILEYIYCCLDHTTTGIYDVVSEANISMHHLAQLIVKLCNSTSKIEIGAHADPQENVKLPTYDFSKSYQIHYKEKYSVENALIRYIQFRKSLLNL